MISIDEINQLRDENAALKEEIKQLHAGRVPAELYTFFGKPIKYWENLEIKNAQLKQKNKDLAKCLKLLDKPKIEVVDAEIGLELAKYKMAMRDVKDLCQWILDQWDLSTKEVQENVLYIINKLGDFE